MATTYPSITGMLYGLSLPIGTPLYVVIIGGFVAIIVGKAIFGGVGNNIFNPALVGRAFVTIAFTSIMINAVKYDAVFSFITIPDGLSSASPLGQAVAQKGLLTYNTFLQTYGTHGFLATSGKGISALFNLMFGFYPSALGESLSFWIILSYIYLAIKKTINWFVPLLYVGLVFIMTWVVAIATFGFNLDGAFNLQTLQLYFPIFQVLTGGLLFGAVFMATEPVTSPITRRGRALFAIYLAIITFSIRLLGKAPEGVYYSILFMNMFVPVMDNFYMGQDKGLTKKEWVLWISTILLVSCSYNLCRNSFRRCHKMIKYLHLTLVLLIISGLSGLILGVTNELTKEPIRQVKLNKINVSMNEWFPSVPLANKEENAKPDHPEC